MRNGRAPSAQNQDPEMWEFDPSRFSSLREAPTFLEIPNFVTSHDWNWPCAVRARVQRALANGGGTAHPSSSSSRRTTPRPSTSGGGPGSLPGAAPGGIGASADRIRIRRASRTLLRRRGRGARRASGRASSVCLAERGRVAPLCSRCLPRAWLIPLLIIIRFPPLRTCRGHVSGIVDFWKCHSFTTACPEAGPTVSLRGPWDASTPSCWGCWKAGTPSVASASPSAGSSGVPAEAHARRCALRFRSLEIKTR